MSHVGLDISGWDLSLILVDTGARHLANDGVLPTRRHALERALARLGTSLEEAAPDQLSHLADGPDPVGSRCARHLITERARAAAAAQQLASDTSGLSETTCGLPRFAQS